MIEYLIPCKIERGGFRSERTFEITQERGKPLIGTAYFDHFCSESQETLGDDEPAEGKSIKGFVKCRLIRRSQPNSELVIVEVPSGDVLTISLTSIVKKNSDSRELAKF